MAIPSRPTGQIKWANTSVNNSPTGGLNKQPYATRFEDIGWTYGEHPPYEVWNEFNYNIYQQLEWAAVSLLQHENDISVLGGGKYVDNALVVTGGSASIPFATHGITDPVVQLQDSSNRIVFADIIVDPANSNVTLQNVENGTYRIIIK